jgi:hypothetical protein
MAALTAQNDGVTFLLSAYGLGAVAIAVFPIAVLVVAAFIGRNKKAGRGAAAFAWLYVVIDATTFNADPLALWFVLIPELLVASGLIVLAVVQRPMQPHVAPDAT